jgi:hypothetical protein
MDEAARDAIRSQLQEADTIVFLCALREGHNLAGDIEEIHAAMSGAETNTNSGALPWQPTDRAIRMAVLNPHSLDEAAILTPLSEVFG